MNDRETAPAETDGPDGRHFCHTGHRNRMKQRYQKAGLSDFHPHEVLEVLLFTSLPRCNTNPMAHAMLEKRSSLAGVLTDPPAVPGAGEKTRVALCRMEDRLETAMTDALQGPFGEKQFLMLALWHLHREPTRLLLVVTGEKGSFVSLHRIDWERLPAESEVLPVGQRYHLAFCGSRDGREGLPWPEKRGMVLCLDGDWQGSWL